MNTVTVTLADFIWSILQDVNTSERNFRSNDVWRTGNCTMTAEGKANFLNMLGIDLETGTWIDGNYHRFAYFKVDDVVLVNNGIIDWKAFCDNKQEWKQIEVQAVKRIVGRPANMVGANELLIRPCCGNCVHYTNFHPSNRGKVPCWGKCALRPQPNRTRNQAACREWLKIED